jgi:hypothetical protein
MRFVSPPVWVSEEVFYVSVGRTLYDLSGVLGSTKSNEPEKQMVLLRLALNRVALSREKEASAFTGASFFLRCCV